MWCLRVLWPWCEEYKNESYIFLWTSVWNPLVGCWAHAPLKKKKRTGVTMAVTVSKRQTHHIPLWCVDLTVLDLVDQTYPAHFDGRRGWRLPAHHDIKVEPWAADVEQGPVQINGGIWLYWRTKEGRVSVLALYRLVLRGEYHGKK